MDAKSSHLTSSELRSLKQRLVEERQRLRRMAGQRDAEPDSILQDDQETEEPSDFGDQGLELTIADTEHALQETDLALIAQVERALARIDDGTYGLSEVTGAPIPLERLQILPWATTNVDD